MQSFYNKAKAYLEQRSLAKPPAERQVLIEEIKASCWRQDIGKLTAAAVGDTSRIRMDALTRVFDLTSRMADLEAEHTIHITKEDQAKLQDFAAQQKGMEAFISAIRTRFSDLNTGWWADVLSSELCHAVAEKAIAHHAEQWCHAVKVCTDKVRVSCVTPATIENPQLLVKPEMQKLLIDNPDKATLSLSVEELGFAVRATDDLKKAGVPIKPVISGDAKAARKLGKTCIGMEWALRKLLQESPSDGTKVADHIQMIKAKLKSKGTEMPAYMWKALDATLAKAKEQVAKAPQAE